MNYPTNNQLPRIPPSRLSPRSPIRKHDHPRPIVHNRFLFDRRATRKPLNEFVSFPRRAAVINAAPQTIRESIIRTLKNFLRDGSGRLDLGIEEEPPKKAPELFAKFNEFCHPWLAMGGKITTEEHWREILEEPELPTDWDLMKNIPWGGIRPGLRAKLYNKSWYPLLDKVAAAKRNRDAKAPTWEDIVEQSSSQTEGDLGGSIGSAPYSEHETPRTGEEDPYLLPELYNYPASEAVQASLSIISTVQQAINDAFSSHQPSPKNHHKRKASHHEQANTATGISTSERRMTSTKSSTSSSQRSPVISDADETAKFARGQVDSEFADEDWEGSRKRVKVEGGYGTGSSISESRHE